MIRIRKNERNTQKTVATVNKPNWFKYKRMLINDIWTAVLDGDENAVSCLENVLEILVKSGSMIANTVLEYFRQNGVMNITDRQLAGLASIADRNDVFIPLYIPSVKNEQAIVPASEQLASDEVGESDVEDCTPAWIQNPDGVRPYDMVEILNTATGKCTCWEIVDRDKASIKDNRMPIGTPIATALLGHVEGETVHVNTPSMTMSFRILGIAR